MARTKIEWCARPGTIPESWSPVTGCSPISEGCKFCYAERMARRLAGRFGYPEAPRHFDVTLHPDRLEQPLHWKKPRTVFVCSMSDLFHRDILDEFIRSIYIEMAVMTQHTFLLLTKRPERALQFYKHYWPGAVEGIHRKQFLKAFPHIWLGITAENQHTADERIPLLLQIPAAVRFVSCEPLLGPINLRHWLGWWNSEEGPEPEGQHGYPGDISWVIAGGESGPNARPMHPDWARGIRDQCQAAGIPYFHKQNGEWEPWRRGCGISSGYTFHFWPDGSRSIRVGKKAAGHLLDSEEWHQWPA